VICISTCLVLLFLENPQKLLPAELRFLAQTCIKLFVVWGFAPDPVAWEAIAQEAGRDKG